MKKIKYLNLVILFVLFCTGITINAEENVSSENIAPPVRVNEKMRFDKKSVKDKIEKEEMIKERSLEKREMIEKKTLERKEKMLERVEDRKIEWKNRVEDRLEAGVSRLSKLIERLESRIAKIDENGGNTSKAKTQLANTKNLLTQATQKIEEIKSFTQTYSEEDYGQDELVQNVLPIAKEVQNLLKESKESLQNTVKILKEDNAIGKLNPENSQIVNE